MDSDLLTARAVRERCYRIGELVAAGQGHWFRLDPDKLDDAVGLVVAECRDNYPDLNIPFHSRWRHFVVGDTDLWQHYAQQRLVDADPAARARTAMDLVFISVLLDAGAGAEWQYADPVTGVTLVRSEGLAAASIDLFFNHLAVPDGMGGLMADDRVLRGLDRSTLVEAFQHGPHNPLLGLDGRLQLLKSLGARLAELKPQGLSRPGGLLDHLQTNRSGEAIAAGELLSLVLQHFNVIWPSGLMLDGQALGDCGTHGALGSGTNGGNLVPFHKLSQWLTYSLLEPLQWSGLQVVELDQLTGLPEYRNGGLLLDTGVLVPLTSELLEHQWSVTHELVVEWRAATVWLLDEIADRVREKLGKGPMELPLASVLQGGTWSAGRKLAYERRGGEPPIKLGIDGTVF